MKALTQGLQHTRAFSLWNAALGSGTGRALGLRTVSPGALPSFALATNEPQSRSLSEPSLWPPCSRL